MAHYVDYGTGSFTLKGVDNVPAPVDYGTGSFTLAGVSSVDPLGTSDAHALSDYYLI